MKTYLMIDLGGTNIKYGISNDLKTVLSKGKMPSETSKGFEHVLNTIKGIIKQFNNVDLIAISQAGIIAKDSSIFFANPKLNGFTGKSFKEELEKEFNILTYVVNDAKASAAYIAKQINDDEALSVVLGTGVGVAMILNKGCFFTELGITGEIGLSIPNELPLDDILSLTLFKKRLVAHDEKLDFADYKIVGKTNQVFQEYLTTLAKWTYNFFVIYGIPNIYFGGSLPAFGEEFLEDLKVEIEKQSPSLGKYIKVRYAPSGEDANMLGALYAALKRYEG